MLIEVHDLGLAAYIKTRGLELVKCEGRSFSFESGVNDDTAMLGVKRELEIAYANSCCRQHDSTVVYLRSMIAPQNRTRG